MISNDLPSTSSVFSHDVLGSMDQEVPRLDMMMPQMEKMYMVDGYDATPWLHQEDEVDHMEYTTTTTPTHMRGMDKEKIRVLMMP